MCIAHKRQKGPDSLAALAEGAFKRRQPQLEHTWGRIGLSLMGEDSGRRPPHHHHRKVLNKKQE